MTTRPRLHTSKSQAVGLLAFALFGVLSAVFLTANFGEHETFNGASEITATIGYAMFDLDAGTLPSEGFLVAFEIIDLVLIAALAVAVMLARREADGGILPLTDGGRETRDASRSGERGTSRPASNDEDRNGGDR
ncbi:hypothetical protein [Natronomonas sp. EA1]|uniref:hypothetical protein n=1 Tax=Natronomonas sp. EA1 TaxID=3421655 RepID=UPI003EBC8519